MAKFKLRHSADPNVTLVQDANICVGSDATGQLWLESRWRITPWLDNDEDKEQLVYVLPPDADWPDKQNATDKDLYTSKELRVVQLRSQKITSYVIAIRPEGTLRVHS